MSCAKAEVNVSHRWQLGFNSSQAQLQLHLVRESAVLLPPNLRLSPSSSSLHISDCHKVYYGDSGYEGASCRVADVNFRACVLLPLLCQQGPIKSNNRKLAVITHMEIYLARCRLSLPASRWWWCWNLVIIIVINFEEIPWRR